MPPKMTANPARPSRYRAGKPTGVESDSSSDGEDGSGNEVAEATLKTKREPPARAPAVAPPKRTGPGVVVTNATLAKAIRHDAQRTQEDDAVAKRRARVALEQKAAEEGFVTESEEEEESGSDEEEEEESGSDDEDEDEDSDSSSDDGLAPRKFVMPKFVPKAQRDKATTTQDEEIDEEQAERERLAAADELVEEQLRKQAAARVSSKKQWEDSNEATAAAAAAVAAAAAAVAASALGEEGAAAALAAAAAAADVDTEDDVDPEAEYAAWKLRELKRIKRVRDRIEEKEAELAEIERRRNLTEEERQAEDTVKVAQQQAEKDGRGKMAYMQKYYHKGAFFQDASAAEGLDKRDLMGARYVDEIRNRDLLPKALQLRDMARLGRKGASKYRDMRSEDTGRWGSGLLDDDRRGGRPDGRYDSWGRERPAGGGYGGGGGGGGYQNRNQDDSDVHGANAIPLGERKSGGGGGGGRRDDRDDRNDRGHGRPRGDRRSRSRSRSPRRDRDRRDGENRDDRRKRSPPSRDDRDRHRDRDGERHSSSDKRRRVET